MGCDRWDSKMIKAPRAIRKAKLFCDIQFFAYARRANTTPPDTNNINGVNQFPNRT
jgi:hypothetical protein